MYNVYTVKPVYKGHPRDRNMVFIDKWSLVVILFNKINEKLMNFVLYLKGGLYS